MIDFILPLKRCYGLFHSFVKKIKRIHILYNIKKSNIKIMTIDETIDELEKGKSIARFGDGEMAIIMGGKIGFQEQNALLSEELHHVLASKPEHCLLCIPDAISYMYNLNSESREFWIDNMIQYRDNWVRILSENSAPDYRYGCAQVSRCYLRFEDKSNCSRWFERIKGLWDNKNIVIVEGEKTCLGCGNDFLSRSNSIRRIIAPAENAFEKKTYILNYIIDCISQDSPIILALGPTASILAYELSERGYWAIDIGHCDIEYEWFKAGVKERVTVSGKYTNEVENGRQVEDVFGDDYKSQIIKQFL